MRKRAAVLLILLAVIVALPALYLAYGGKFTFSAQGQANAGYIVLADGRIKPCRATAGTDSSSGQPCLPMTRAVKQVFEEAKKSGKSDPEVFVESPTVFFNPNPATSEPEPVIWHCERGDGKCHFTRIPLRDPVTGEPCQPVTADMARRFARGEKNACRGEDEQERSSLNPLPMRPPFAENFEDGHVGNIRFSGDWMFSSLSNGTNGTQCGEGAHCVCTRAQGTFQFPMELIVSRQKAEAYLGFLLFGSGLRFTVMARTADGVWLQFNHNEVRGDATPVSWAIGRSGIGPPQVPAVALASGWQRISLYFTARNFTEEYFPRQTHQEPVYKSVSVRRTAKCSFSELLWDVLPFVDDCDWGEKTEWGSEQRVSHYNTIEDSPGQRVFRWEVAALLGAQGSQSNAALMPELTVETGQFVRYDGQQGNPPEQVGKLTELQVQVTHLGGGTICLDELLLRN